MLLPGVCKGETHPCGVGLAIAAACHSEHPIKSLAKGQELPALKKKLKEFVWFVYFTELCTFVSLRQKLNTEMSSVKQEGSISAQKTRPDGGLFGFFFTTFSPHCCCEILWLIIKCLTDCCVCTADWLKLCCVVSSFRALYTGPMGRDQRQSLGSWTRPPGAVPAWLGR